MDLGSSSFAGCNYADSLYCYVRTAVPATIPMKSDVFWDKTPYGQMKFSRCFGGEIATIFVAEEKAEHVTSMKQAAIR